MPPLAIDPGIEGRLRIRHLSVLVAVAEAKSMQTAAQRVNVTAGAVSVTGSSIVTSETNRSPSIRIRST